jgi:DNA/RNA non-specific endonuclease/HNH endonuclease
MPRLAGLPLFELAEFTFEAQRRRRVASVMVQIRHGWPAASTPRTGAVPRALRQTDGSYDLRIHNTDAGHLLALEFGGPNSENNLVPMWGRFNKHGAWRQFEADLQALLATRGRVSLEIGCDYLLSDDARVPAVFRITARDGVWSREWTIDHVRPLPRPSAPDPGFAALVRKAREEMNTLFPGGFFIESVFERTRTGQRLRLPAREPEQRPYAVLDYMALSKAIDFELLRDVDNGREFDGPQRGWILALNRLDNEGVLVTDVHEDFAAVSSESHEDAYGNVIWHGDYVVHDFPLGVLIEAGGDQAPEVDHVIPKSFNGCNAFSNAQVISRAYNQWKSARVPVEDRERLADVRRKRTRDPNGGEGSSSSSKVPYAFGGPHSGQKGGGGGSGSSSSSSSKGY